MAANPPASDPSSKEPASSTMAQSLSLPSISTNASLKGTLDPPKSTATAPKIASLTSPAKNLKRPSSPSFDIPPPLTGAAAMVDNARHRELEESKQAQMTSVNPATAAKDALMGNAAFGGSRTSTSASTTAQQQKSGSSTAAETSPAITTSTSRPNQRQPAGGEHTSSNSILQNSTTTSEPLSIEPTHTSPISMTGSEGSNSANVFAVNNGSVDSSKTNTSAEMSHDEKKALTYPPQIMPGDHSNNAPSTPVRGMSVPGSSKSPINKKHKCPHCSTEFTRHHNLKSHLLTHSQEKPYGCNNCSSRFRRLHDLKRHLKLHTGERPHTCLKCGRKFARGDALARHSKGPGGCAGRRGSMGGDGDYDDSVMDADMSMEGVEYTGGDNDDDGDDSPGTFPRRRSEPNRMRKQSLNPQGNLHSSPGPGGSGSGAAEPSPYRQHSSTYPGGLVAPQAPAMGRGSPSRNLYPPGSHPDQSLSSSTSNRHLSPKSAADRGSGVFNSHGSSTAAPVGSSGNSSANLFSHSNVNLTESPKSLSPGGPAHRQLPSSSSAQQAQPASSSAASGLSLPPLVGFAGSSSSSSSVARQPSASSPSAAYPPAPPALPPGGGEVWEHIRNFERRMTEEMNQRLQSQEQHYESKISKLQEELASLRGKEHQQQRQLPSAFASGGSDTASNNNATTSVSETPAAPTVTMTAAAIESAPSTLPAPSSSSGGGSTAPATASASGNAGSTSGSR